ncbi:hypothetical protein [Mesorhizobium sp. B2-4-11]|uniref:hypothetical protein n=1 Tax=Mesorhizobium sp. B2-4-11 TaxID=2589938 RepID=UPI00112971E5|nr:hypothetical protein [Mesorhizobium sp. B2-4-11]TPL12881.1 hypothetical protein FJ944_08035 [Mesorhizobium sp. B2-4-11]
MLENLPPFPSVVFVLNQIDFRHDRNRPHQRPCLAWTRENIQPTICGVAARQTLSGAKGRGSLCGTRQCFRFRDILSHELSPEQKHVVENLLAKEELKLRVLEAADDSTIRSGPKLIAAALSTHHRGEAISISSTIEAVRWALPGCIENDAELTAYIVRYAKERQLIARFDAR